jgi:hypothetical protein
MFYLTVFFSLFLSNIQYILQILFLFISMISKYRVYVLYDKKQIINIYKYIQYSTFIDEQKIPHGFILGKKFIGFINKNNTLHALHSSEKILYIWIHENDFKKLCIHTDEIEENHIHYWYREGSYWNLQYKKRPFLIDILPNEKQELIINDISSYYAEFNKGVFFIFGEPGKGKSTLLQLLGNFYKGHTCKTFKMTDPNDTLEYLYRQVEPTKEKPLIILFDEIDTLIHSIHNNEVLKHKHFPIEVYNKTTYNTFFDNMNDNLYPYVILLLTSNKSKEKIAKETHSCYLREGRVNKYFHL